MIPSLMPNDWAWYRSGFVFNLVVLLFMPLISFAALSPPDSLIIETILFVGNDQTKDFILAREMQLKEGDPYNAEIAEQDRQRIQNLRLFNRVEFQLLPGEQGIIVLVLVAEKWYIFPYPIFFIHDRDWDKLSYGAGLIYENVSGRNVTFTGNFYLGYNPSISFNYRNPWMHGRRKVSLSVSAYYNRVSNNSLLYSDFDEQHLGLAVSIGHRLGFHGSVELGAEYRQVRVPAQQGVSLSETGIDRLPALALRFKYDRRDYYVLPLQGWYLYGYLQAVYNGGSADYQLAGFDLRRYQPLPGGISVAVRGKLDVSWGRVPVYNHFYIGYSERIRGHFQTILEGEQRSLASAELRLPIVKTRYININHEDKPWSSYMRDLPVGCNATIFYDAGISLMQEQSWSKTHWLSGFGIGLNVQLPYVEMIRFERAWNAAGQGEYIVDMKVWF